MKTKTKTGAAPRRRHRFSFLTVHNPFKTSGSVHTPKRQVALRSWLKRVADCSPALQMVGEDGNVFVTTLDGLPHPIGSHSQLRTLSAEQMEEVLVAINARLPSSLCVSFRAGERQGLLAILEDLLGYSQSETPKAPRRSSISTVTPRTPLSPLVNGRDAPAMSPFQFVPSPSATCTSPDGHSSPTRLAAARALHGITALLIPPPVGIPAPLLNGHAERLRSLEPPSTPTRSACESPLFTPVSRKRMLEPVAEDVRAEQEGQDQLDAARGKRRRTVSGTRGSVTEEVGTLRRTKTTGSMANTNAERRVTRALAARLAVENMRVTRSMSATGNLSTSVSWSPRRPPRPARNPARRDSVASTSSQSTVGAHTLPPATSRSSTPTQPEYPTGCARIDAEEDAADWSASSSPTEVRDALSTATLKAFTSALPDHDATHSEAEGTGDCGVLTTAEVEYEAAVSDGYSDTESVSLHTDTTTDESSESESGTPLHRATYESSSSSSTPTEERDEDVFNADPDALTDDENDAYAKLKSASIWFRSPESDCTASEAPSSPCARLADRSAVTAESTPRASTWMFVTQTRRRVDVSPVRIKSAARGQSRIPRAVTSPQADRAQKDSKLFLQRSPRSTIASAQRGTVTRSAFVASSPAGSLFSPAAASPVTRARSLILPASPVALGTATASPLARSAVGNAFRSASRARARSNSDVSTPSSRASDWRAPTASPTPRGRSRLPKVVA